MIAVDTIAITVKNKGDKGGFCSYWQSLHVFCAIICRQEGRPIIYHLIIDFKGKADLNSVSYLHQGLRVMGGHWRERQPTPARRVDAILRRDVIQPRLVTSSRQRRYACSGVLTD